LLDRASQPDADLEQVVVTVSLNINAEKLSSSLPAETTVLRFFRDELSLTGTKNGCSTNHCGACTVLVNGRATESCLLRVARLIDAEIVTIEGLSPPGVLHPIQAGSLAAGAVQCGLCTAGMIPTTRALLDTAPDPIEAEIREALKDNVCRGSGYSKIIDAVKLAARWLRNPREMKLSQAGGEAAAVRIKAALEQDVLPQVKSAICSPHTSARAVSTAVCE
jgi:aerobic-type carbon monoxide dehydrogenase small subunit (CoxS/CutS family)